MPDCRFFGNTRVGPRARRRYFTMIVIFFE
jgi:hypothetical protein